MGIITYITLLSQGCFANEHIACKQALSMGYSEIASYSKANLGITHTESLFAGE